MVKGVVKCSLNLAICLCFVGSLVGFTATADTVWTGNVSTNWADTKNWDNGVPAAGDGFTATIPGYLERNPIVGKEGGEVGGNLVVQTGALLTLKEGDLVVNGAIVVEVGAEIEVNDGCTLESIGDHHWVIRGTLTLLPGSRTHMAPTCCPVTSFNIIIDGSLIAKGTPEKWITIGGSSYPRRMGSLFLGSRRPALNIVMEYVTMPHVFGGIAISMTPRAFKLSHLKEVGVLCSVGIWSGGYLLISDSNLVAPVHAYWNGTLELVRCNLPDKDPVNFHHGLDKGWVISREDVDNKGAYIYWAGSKGMDWHAGSVAPTEKDNVIIRDNTWSETDCVIISSEAVCNDLIIDVGAKLVIKEGAKLIVHGSFTNNGTLEDPSAGLSVKKTS